MAGPTAVSALIHAADTWLPPAVYMLSRCSPLFDLSPVALTVVLIVAAFTAFFAATIAITQNDIKKVLAYSTVSQLGYMMMAAGAGAYVFSIFHLVTHAFFKALLFLGAGSVIHAMAGEQDIRKMGGLRGMIPVTAVTFLVATLAISGFPLLSGFFSKDEILASLYDGGHTFFWTAGLITAVLTAFYHDEALRAYLRGDSKDGLQDEKAACTNHPAVMTVPLVILAVLSVFGGLLGVPEFMGESVGFHYTDLIKKFLSSSVVVHYGRGTCLLPLFWLLGPCRVFGAGSVCGNSGRCFDLLSQAGREAAAPRGKTAAALKSGSFNKWYVDEIYEAVFVSPFNYISGLCSDFDRSFIDSSLDGLSDFVRNLSGTPECVADRSAQVLRGRHG